MGPDSHLRPTWQHILSSVLRLDFSRFEPLAALRCTIGMGVPLLIALALHQPGAGVFIAVGAVSVVVFAPLHALLIGYDGILRMGLAENLLQVVVQGILAGVLPIYLFARAVILLGAGRAATFPALVPGFSMIIGYLALGVVPSVLQLIGLVIVVIGFRFVVR